MLPKVLREKDIGELVGGSPDHVCTLTPVAGNKRQHPASLIQEMPFIRKDTSFEVKTDGAFCRTAIRARAR
jgi:hypothetical protein